MMAHVRLAQTPEELYLIPEDMMRFRLETGARTFVDWKSHPYRDSELLEWYRRIELVKALAKINPERYCDEIHRLVLSEGITHVVSAASNKWRACEFLNVEYADAAFCRRTHGRLGGAHKLVGTGDAVAH